MLDLPPVCDLDSLSYGVIALHYMRQVSSISLHRKTSLKNWSSTLLGLFFFFFPKCRIWPPLKFSQNGEKIFWPPKSPKNPFFYRFKQKKNFFWKVDFFLGGSTFGPRPALSDFLHIGVFTIFCKIFLSARFDSPLKFSQNEEIFFLVGQKHKIFRLFGT